jgi:hypothetical protein
MIEADRVNPLPSDLQIIILLHVLLVNYNYYQ